MFRIDTAIKGPDMVFSHKKKDIYVNKISNHCFKKIKKHKKTNARDQAMRNPWHLTDQDKVKRTHENISLGHFSLYLQEGFS